MMIAGTHDEMEDSHWMASLRAESSARNKSAAVAMSLQAPDDGSEMR